MRNAYLSGYEAASTLGMCIRTPPMFYARSAAAGGSAYHTLLSCRRLISRSKNRLLVHRRTNNLGEQYRPRRQQQSTRQCTRAGLKSGAEKYWSRPEDKQEIVDLKLKANTRDQTAKRELATQYK